MCIGLKLTHYIRHLVPLYRVMKIDLKLRFFDDTNAISFLFTNILVASDYFTRWVEAYAIPNQEVVTVANKLVDA